eukprot:m51a1_g2921 putative rna polymerase-associated protein leo1 (296) ;mRNA; r:539162-540312
MATKEDLFGSDDDEEEASSPPTASRAYPGTADDDEDAEHSDRAPEPSAEPTAAPEEEILLDPLRLPRPASAAPLFLIKLPPSIAVANHEYTAQSYRPPVDHATGEPVPPRPTIRWRNAFDENGHAIVESNARIVRWKDGRWQLYIGSSPFEIRFQDLSKEHHHLFSHNGQDMQSHGVVRARLVVSGSEHVQLRQIAVSIPPRSKVKLVDQAEEQIRVKGDNDADATARLRHKERAYGGTLTAEAIEGDDDAAPMVKRQRRHTDQEREAEQRMLDAKSGGSGSAPLRRALSKLKHK